MELFGEEGEYIIVVKKRKCVETIKLSDFEKRACEALGNGLSQKEIAASLGCSQQNISSALDNARRKNKCKSNFQLVVKYLYTLNKQV